jgi:hypothetical protein
MTARSAIREPQSAARLCRTFAKGLSAGDLAEPLLSLDESQPSNSGVKLMRAREVSVIGVRRAGRVAGWVGLDDLEAGTLGERLREFCRENVLDETVSLGAVLDAFAKSDPLFIEWRGEVVGVITQRDLQKPPLRMWLFGAITVLDTNMTWAIEELYPDDAWRGLISPGRCEKAAALHAQRQQLGSDCRLVDCLQIKDKADILVSDRKTFDVLGVGSRREADRLAREIESLRNQLAHTQELEQKHLCTAARLASAIDSILRAEVAQRIVEVRRGQE